MAPYGLVASALTPQRAEARPPDPPSWRSPGGCRPPDRAAGDSGPLARIGIGLVEQVMDIHRTAVEVEADRLAGVRLRVNLLARKRRLPVPKLSGRRSQKGWSHPRTS
jgi:hypothetical protein